MKMNFSISIAMGLAFFRRWHISISMWRPCSLTAFPTHGNVLQHICISDFLCICSYIHRCRHTNRKTLIYTYTPTCTYWYVQHTYLPAFLQVEVLWSVAPWCGAQLTWIQPAGYLDSKGHLAVDWVCPTNPVWSRSISDFFQLQTVH